MYIGMVKPARNKVVVPQAIAAKVQAAAARIAMTKEKALEIAAAEPPNATIFAGPARSSKEARRLMGLGLGPGRGNG